MRQAKRSQLSEHLLRSTATKASIWVVRVPSPLQTGHGPNPSKSTIIIGCVGIADCVVVRSRDNTEHDNNLLHLIKVANDREGSHSIIPRNAPSRQARSNYSGLSMTVMESGQTRAK